MKKQLVFMTATIVAALGLVGLEARAVSQDRTKQEENPFFSGSRRLEAYSPGIDYMPGEVMIAIRINQAIPDKELESKLLAVLERGFGDYKLMQRKETVAGQEITLPKFEFETLDAVKMPEGQQARICGGRIVTVRFNIDQLTEQLLKDILAAINASGLDDIGDFTPAPGDTGTKPSMPAPRKGQDARLAKGGPQGLTYAQMDARGVKIAVIDSGSEKIKGIRYEMGHDFVYPKFMPATEGMKDYYTFTNMGGPEDGEIYEGHGTGVAGLIAQPPVPSLGIAAGLAQNATIIPIAACDERRVCRGVNVIKALCYAASKEADVINLSLGGFVGSKPVRQAVLDARDAGSTIVMSSGNSRNPAWGIVDTPQGLDVRKNPDGRPGFLNEPVFPAAWSENPSMTHQLDGLISVGAVNPFGQISSFTTVNPSVDVFTLGEELMIYNRKGMPESRSGTSFAAPLISAVAGVLVKEERLGNPSVRPDPRTIEGRVVFAPNTSLMQIACSSPDPETDFSNACSGGMTEFYSRWFK